MKISEVTDPQSTMTLWHGGRNLQFNHMEMLPAKKGRWEYGPGLYLTTHYDTARKYAKGGGTVYKIIVEKGTELSKVDVSIDDAVAFVKRYAIGKYRNNLIEDLKNNFDRLGALKLSVLINLCVNYECLSSKNTVALRKFVVEQGADYEISRGFGGRSETIVIVFNPAVIKKVIPVKAADVPVSEFEQTITEDAIDKKELLKSIKNSVNNGISGPSFDIMGQHFDIDTKENLYINGVLDRSNIIGGIKGKIINYLYNNALSKEKTKSVDIQASQAEKFFKHNKKMNEVRIDNKDGAGATPNNEEIDYFGFRILMKPSIFLKLAATMDSEKVDRLVDYVKQGGAIASPFLRVSIPDAWREEEYSEPASIVSHEGRHRMIAVQKIDGDTPIEVHMLFAGGLRARNIKSEWFQLMNNEMYNEDGNLVKGPFFQIKK